MKKPAKATAVDVVKAATKRVIRVRQKPAPAAPAEPRRPATRDAVRVPEESRF